MGTEERWNALKEKIKLCIKTERKKNTKQDWDTNSSGIKNVVWKKVKQRGHIKCEEMEKHQEKYCISYTPVNKPNH